MAYSKNTWNNLDPTTPLNAARMNKIEAGIESANAIIGNDGKVTDAGLPARLSDATLRAAFGALDAETKSNLRSIIAKGDSLTVGNQDASGYTFPSFLATALGTGVAVTNAGRSGWSSTEVAIRDGGLPVVLDAFALPAATTATAVTISSPTGHWNADPATWSGVLNVGGTLYPGTLVHAAAGATTFARSAAGSSVSVSAGATFTCTEQTSVRGNLTIIEVGRNNADDTSAPTRVPADVAAMVANLSPTIKRYLVLSAHTSSSETSGSTRHTRTAAVNAALAAAHGTRYVDTRRYLIDSGLAVNGLTPTTADNTAMAGDTIPPQILESDGIHPNRYGYKAMAQAILDRLVSLDWAPDKVTPLPALAVTLPTATVTFDPASLTTGAAVASVPVTQGSGTAAQGTAGKQPTVVTSGGRQWVSLDGVDDELAVSSPLLTQPFTIIMRVKARTLTNLRGLVWPSGSGATARILADGSVAIGAAGGSVTTPAGQVAANAEVVIGIVLAGASSLLQVGANPVVAGNPGTAGVTSGFWRIGYAFSGSDVYAPLDVNKIKVFPVALNATQLAQAIAEL